MWDVFYEIDQIINIPRIPKHDDEENEKRLTESVYLALLVHARLLYEFFGDKPKKDDDVHYSDFGFRIVPIKLSDDHRERLNKDIAHLTYARPRHTEASQPWPVGDILRPVRERAALFVSHVVSHPPEGTPPAEIARWKALENEFKKQGITGA